MKKKETYRIFQLPLLIIGLLYLLINTPINSQESKDKEAAKLFIKIEEGLSSGAVDKFSGSFSGKNFLSLSSGISGYYSANQSYYVIKDFLSIYQPISFKFNNIVTETNNPFASGILRYNNKGIRGTAMVFVSLQYIGNQLRISQITIN